MRQLLHRFNDMKLRNKMVLSYLLFFILPFMLVGFFVVQEYRQSALTKATEQIENTVGRVKARTDEVLNVAIGLSSRLSLDTDLESIATTRYRETGDVVDAYRSYGTFKTYLDFNPEVSGIKLFVDNPTLLNNWEFYPLDEETKKSFWYKASLDHAGLIGWYYYPDVTRYPNSMLSLVRSIYFQESRSFGVLAIDVNTNALNAILSSESPETVLVDGSGLIVASNRSGLTGHKVAETHLGAGLAALAPGLHEVKVDGQRAKVRIDEFMPEKSYTTMKIITVFSIGSIVKEANRISSIGLTFIGVFFVIALLLIYLICTVLTNRLLKFSRHINVVSTGNFATTLAIDSNDEIGQITRRFNQMVANVRDLMDEVKRSHEERNLLERKQSEIQLKMLASQINPHFLYNALESIRMKAHLSGEKEIAHTVKTLGKLLRKNLELKGRAVTLRDEMEIVRSYLDIQKFRHEDRVHYEIDVDPVAEEALLPPLLIQPLVENSVIHGLERDVNGGTVRIRARLDQGALVIAVEDDGVGMSAGKLSEVMAALGDPDAERIGLNNVQQRLLLAYGEEAGLAITSEKNKGTRIAFRIPVEGSEHV